MKETDQCGSNCYKESVMILYKQIYVILGANNLITDGFFDVGQLRPDARLKILEEYVKEEINQRRPVILVNAKPEYDL